MVALLAQFHSDKDEHLKLLGELQISFTLKKKGLVQEAEKCIEKLYKAVLNGEINFLREDILAAYFNLLSTNMEANMEQLLNIVSEVEKQGRTVVENGQATALFLEVIGLRSTINSYCTSRFNLNISCISYS